MTKEELLAALKAAVRDDIEVAHSLADAALIAFINDPEVQVAYDAVPKWYA